MGTAFSISESEKPTIGIYFDADKTFDLDYAAPSSGLEAWSPSISSHSNVYLRQKQIAFMPFAGTSSPGLRRFKVKFDYSGDGEYDSGYYLALNFLMDSNGEASGVTWTVVYTESYDPNEAAVGTPQVVTTPNKNADGTFYLEPRTYGEADTSSGLIISSFQLGDHSGSASMKSSGSTIRYQATEL